ncbi:uncharacterized protein, partial [Nicotiana sylvestris]|uniref:uncharacterized protein n=1 Tax=Nicotiana sylvestris TaxID=4096 RepID=UPI00388C702D
AELSQSEDSKLPELEGDVGKLQKTHNTVALYTAAGTSKQVNKKPHINVNLNNVFDKPFTSKKPREAIVIAPQTTTYANSLHHNKKVYNHITQTYIENIYKIQTFLNLNPRSTTTTDPTQDYVTQKLQGYNRLIAQPKTKANLVKTCYNYGLLSTVYTHDGEEIIGIPELYKAFVTFKRITKGNLFFIKFYTAPAEILYDEIKPIIQVIKIGLTRDMIIPEEIEKQPEIQKMEIPSFYANKRIIGIATIIQELANNYLQGNEFFTLYGMATNRMKKSEAVHRLWELADSEEAIIYLSDCLFVYLSGEERMEETLNRFLVSQSTPLPQKIVELHGYSSIYG